MPQLKGSKTQFLHKESFLSMLNAEIFGHAVGLDAGMEDTRKKEQLPSKRDQSQEKMDNK